MAGEEKKKTKYDCFLKKVSKKVLKECFFKWWQVYNHFAPSWSIKCKVLPYVALLFWRIEHLLTWLIKGWGAESPRQQTRDQLIYTEITKGLQNDF